ncbi:MAG: GNAT family N-acetyltransferase [Gemmataceae bacterium]
MTWSIRPANSTDAPLLIEHNRLMALETENKVLDPDVLARGVQAALADPAKGRYFVALDEQGRMAGQMMFTFEWSDWRNGYFWWLQSVFVPHEFRRQGVFAALFQHVLELARNDPQVVGIRLYVEHDNLRAQETYRRSGLSQTGYLVYEREFTNP